MFNNVLALDIAAVLAACLTCICSVFDVRRYNSREASAGPLPVAHFWQRRLGPDSKPNHTGDLESVCAPRIRGITRVTSASRVELAYMITALLKRSLEHPNDYSRGALWSRGLLTRALEAWLAGTIIITVVNRSDMIRHGHGDTHSFCSWDADVLHITAGFLEEAETMAVQWQEPLSILYVPLLREP